MVKKSFNQEEDKSFSNFNDEKKAEIGDASSTEGLISALRSDYLPASEAEPASESISQRVNIKLVGGIFIILILLVMIWFLLSGPGRGMLETKLAGLVKVDKTPTQQFYQTPTISISLSAAPSNTPYKSPTVRPTNTQAAILFPSPTLIPPTMTPEVTATPSSACRDALTITLADVGKTLCVQGTVIETISNPSNFMVIFSTEKGSFYLVTYDLVWSQGELDTCYQVTGTIDQIANSPIMLFSYSNLPEVCP
jgi:hypothetical protein